LLKARPGDGTYIQSSLSRVLNQHFQWMLLLREVQHLEIYELRRIIEPEAAALAARRATTDDLDCMSNALEAMRADLHNPTLFHSHDIEFHEAFMQASGNAAIRTTMRMLYHANKEARLRVLPLIDNMDNHFGRHERMFRHINNREPALARKAVLDDLLYAEKLLRQQLQAEQRAVDSVSPASSAAQPPKKLKARVASKNR
jgi:GntR family transcriptional repressor for pyruvate dehydrogenase complex